MLYALEREEVSQFMCRLYEKNLTTCSGGNISQRLDDGNILITPSALDKGKLTAESIAIVSKEGTNLTPHLRMSIETAMHLEIYSTRKDIKAIVHGHPPYGSLYSATGKTLRTDIIAESHLVLGIPIIAPYALMGTQDLALNVAKALENRETSVVLMENHGVITAGENIFKAYDKIEVLEAAAKMSFMGELLGGLKPLSSEQIVQIDKMRNF